MQSRVVENMHSIGDVTKLIQSACMQTGDKKPDRMGTEGCTQTVQKAVLLVPSLIYRLER